MKKILIVSKAFATGGIESSLVNLANELQKYYRVDILAYDPTGITKERLHESVRILPVSWRLNALGTPLKRALKSKEPAFVLFRLAATIWTKVFSNRLPIAWAIQHQEKLTGYDLAISFHQEMGKHTVASGFSRVVDRCVEAKCKVAWLHYDSTAIDLDSSFNNPFYEKMNKIVCVSRSLKEGFVKKFPQFRDKTEYCYNFLDEIALEEKSRQPQTVAYPPGSRVCFSASRLAEEKALVRGIRCLAPVFREHRQWVWYIAGEGPEKEKMENTIRREGLEKQIILLGNLENPYPYMKQADLLMNVSYHEAAPMVFLEARALGVPIFATRTSSAEELVEEPQCGFVCENSEEGMYRAFRDLMDNPEKLRIMKERLIPGSGSNACSWGKIQSWMED